MDSLLYSMTAYSCDNTKVFWAGMLGWVFTEVGRLSSCEGWALGHQRCLASRVMLSSCVWA